MAKKEDDTAITKAPIIANDRGLVLTSLEDMYRFAEYVVSSQLVPRGMTKAAQILIAVQMGAELGMPPMRALQSFCVVNGQARLWGDAPLALVRQSGLLEYIKEGIEGDGEDMVAWCETKRKGDSAPMRTEFSVEDAKTAGLWKKAGTWQQYPKRMLKYRARSFNLRDNFPDCFAGSTIAEEYEGIDPPTAVPTPEVPKREARKQIEFEVTDSNAMVKEELVKALGSFQACLESPLCLNRQLDMSDPNIEAAAWKAFALFSAINIGGGPDTAYVWENPTRYTSQLLVIIHELLNDASNIPSEVMALIPDAPLTTEEVEAHAADILSDTEPAKQWQCEKGHTFPKPMQQGTEKKARQLCPECLTAEISEVSDG